MNVVLHHPVMSLEEFLDWENRQEDRWEFDGYKSQAMVGGTAAHNQIAAEVYAREGDRWVRSTVTGDDVLTMPEIDVEMRLAEAYAGLELGTQPG